LNTGFIHSNTNVPISSKEQHLVHKVVYRYIFLFAYFYLSTAKIKKGHGYRKLYKEYHVVRTGQLKTTH